MDSILIELDSEHKQCIVSLINKIVAKSPHLTDLKSDSIVFMRLVSVISLIETTLCSKYQIILKRNSTHNQSIQLIKSWLQQYYNQEFITSLCQTRGQTVDKSSESAGKCGVADSTGTNVDMNANEGNNDSNVADNLKNIEHRIEDIDRDIAFIALLILIIAHKLRQSLPRINAYFSPEWQTLSLFESVLKEWINFDKILDLVQNELCVKRKQLEVTRSKVLSLQSTINSRNSEQNRHKKSKLDYRSNLFAEYEDMDMNEEKDLIGFDDNEDAVSEYSEGSGSAIFIDRSSDDDYEPQKGGQQKMSSTKSSVKRFVKRGSVGRKSGRGRGRPPKDSLNPIRITREPKSGKSRGRPPKVKPIVNETEAEVEAETETGEPFVCDICGKRFAKEYRLTRHSFTHLGRKQFVCDFSDCNESFDLKWKLAEHKLEHNGQNGAQEDESINNNSHYFECEWADCGLGFTSKRELTVHEHEMHANRSISKYSCDWPNCSEVFENKIEWRKHVRTHGKITPTMAFKIACGYPGCEKSFYKMDLLENHRKIHETFTLDELS